MNAPTGLKQSVLLTPKAFTLIELLVVISILAVLAGMLLPVLRRGLETAHAVTCANNVKGIGTAIILYANDHPRNLLPARQIGNFGTWPRWSAAISKYLDGADQIAGRYRNSIYDCPAVPRWYPATVNGSYGVNTLLMGVTWWDGNPTTDPRIRYTRISRPGNVVMLADTNHGNNYEVYDLFGANGANINDPQAVVPSLYNFDGEVNVAGWNWGTYSADVRYRHPGGVASFGYADGHAGSIFANELRVSNLKPY